MYVLALLDLSYTNHIRMWWPQHCMRTSFASMLGSFYSCPRFHDLKGTTPHVPILKGTYFTGGIMWTPVRYPVCVGLQAHFVHLLFSCSLQLGKIYSNLLLRNLCDIRLLLWRCLVAPHCSGTKTYVIATQQSLWETWPPCDSPTWTAGLVARVCGVGPKVKGLPYMVVVSFKRSDGTWCNGNMISLGSVYMWCYGFTWNAA